MDILSLPKLSKKYKELKLNNPEFIKVSQNEYYQGTERNNPKEVDENLTVVETQIEVQDPV